MRVLYKHGDHTFEVEISPGENGGKNVTIDGVTIRFDEVSERAGALELRSEAGLVRAWVSAADTRRFVSAPGVGEVVLERVLKQRNAAAHSHDAGLSSPMPGRVVRVDAVAGQLVAKGAVLVVVEAMKTELTIAAPGPARVAKVLVSVGDMAAMGAILVELAPELEG